MRKTSYYFLLAVILAFIIAGCSDEAPLPEPKVTVNNGMDILVDADSLDSLLIPIAVTSQDYLYSVKIFALDNSGNEHILKNYFFDHPIDTILDTCRYADFVKENFPSINHLSSLNTTATTRPNISKTASAAMIFSNFGLPLPSERSFLWKRVGINDGEGLDMFGLKWVNTVAADNASIEKDRAERMVLLTVEQWDNITDEDQLINAINTAKDIDNYQGISTLATADYEDVLGIIFDAKYYILYITHATVTEEAVIGKTVTVDGFYKVSTRQ